MASARIPVHPTHGGRGGFAGRFSAIPWIAAPLAIHLAILGRFWFDTPILDDFDCILLSMDAMARAEGLGDWLKHLFALQNEHRLAGTRLMPQLLAWATGSIDFRVLMLTGSLFMFAVLGFLWAEFRDEATGPIAAAAAFLLLQWSYNEAFLMASAATAHLGVVFFAFAGLFFALRPGWPSAALCLAGGVLATFSQANGLFVLPLASLACFILGYRRRATLFLAVGAALWLVYFIGYVGNPHHPSPLKALESPVATLRLFLVIIGGVTPNLQIAQLAGAVLLAALAWLTWKGLWRRHPTAYLWIAFVLVSAAAVAVGRVGFGLHYGSRYAVNAALLMAMAVFGIHALTRPWRRGADLAAMAACAVIAGAILVEALPAMRDRAFKGRLLVEVAPGGHAPGLARFHGAQHPNEAHANRILEVAGAKDWYSPPRYRVELPTVTASARRPAAGSPIGVMDEVTPLGASVILRGWTHIPATVPGRGFILHPADGVRSVAVESLQPRPDVAAALRRPDALLTGFRIVARFDSEEAARTAAAALCLYVEAPGHPITVILRNGAACT